MPNGFDGNHPLGTLCQAWLEKIQLGLDVKKPFRDVADECMQFYSASNDFMWRDEYKRKFFNASKSGALSPRFRLTISKAFELVALFGPVLYYRNPIRQVTPRKPLELTGAMFGPPGDPAGEFMLQQMQMQQEMNSSQDKLRADLMSRYLNYTPNELPGGGLAQHSTYAITEALIKGAGCLWTEPYKYPGSERMIVGSFWDSVDGLVVDPDAVTLENAMWIARKCVHPTWQVERDYNLPHGLLKGKGNLESFSARGETTASDMGDRDRKMGKTADTLVYWKVYSKMGIGGRLDGMKAELVEQLDEQLGDYCYLAVAAGVPFPLNAYSGDLLTNSDEETQQSFDWPVPFWKDDRWPVTCLSFYSKPNSVWPIAPLAPGLGELKAINIIMSHLLNRVWSSSRDFIAVLKGAAEEIKSKILNGEDQTLIEVESQFGDITKVVSFLQQPQTNYDVWKIIDQLFALFDKRVGLTELAYGMSSRQMRSAAEANQKYDQVNVRPDHMAKQVETWMTEVARREAMAVRWYITADDMETVLPGSGQLWSSLVEVQDPDKVVREMEYRIEAGSTRKPNKDRDTANAQQAMQFLLPILQAYSQATGETRQLNEFVETWGKAADFDTTEMMLGQWQNPMQAIQLQQAELGLQQQMMMQGPPPGQEMQMQGPPPQ